MYRRRAERAITKCGTQILRFGQEFYSDLGVGGKNTHWSYTASLANTFHVGPVRAECIGSGSANRVTIEECIGGGVTNTNTDRSPLSNIGKKGYVSALVWALLPSAIGPAPILRSIDACATPRVPLLPPTPPPPSIKKRTTHSLPLVSLFFSSF
ncbi:hypothetical protein J6590_034829 [Homalodisca vitripennis]|nr:hypothetical protein J6590_034829 [Homalodisca vitripennis]